MSLSETVVAAEHPPGPLEVAEELWRYRGVFAALAIRDIKVRYKQTVLGLVWVLLQPLATSGIFAAVLRNLGAAHGQTSRQDWLFFLAGFAPWTAFSSALTSASASLEAQANLFGKIYFPRLIAPGASVLGSVLDYLLSFTLLAALAFWEGAGSVRLLGWMPLLLAIQLMTAMGLGLILAALNAQYRDVKHALPFLLLMGLVVSVLSPLESWSQPARTFLSFNPMAVVVASYRALIAGSPVDGALITQGLLVALGLLGAGVWFFRRREAHLVDVL